MFIQHLGCQMDSAGCFSQSLSKMCEQKKKKPSNKVWKPCNLPRRREGTKLESRKVWLLKRSESFKRGLVFCIRMIGKIDDLGVF